MSMPKYFCVFLVFELDFFYICKQNYFFSFCSYEKAISINQFTCSVKYYICPVETGQPRKTILQIVELRKQIEELRQNVLNEMGKRKK